MIQVDVLYFEGCPHHEPALQLVRNVIHELGIAAEVREIDVETAEDAVRLRFLGSPTIQVDGVDIEPARTNDTSFGMSCRRLPFIPVLAWGCCYPWAVPCVFLLEVLSQHVTGRPVFQYVAILVGPCSTAFR